VHVTKLHVIAVGILTFKSLPQSKYIYKRKPRVYDYKSILFCILQHSISINTNKMKE